jgi:hypothetical protein
MSSNKIKIKLRNIEVHEFAIFDEEDITVNKELGYQAGFSYSLLEEKKQIECLITIELIQEKKIFLKLKASVAYLIKDDDFKTFRNENSVIIPKILLRVITDQSIGTVRGILFAKLEKTDYNKFYLPLMDISQIVDEDEVFNID